MANGKENYLRMLILFLPYLDCHFFFKYEFTQEELENEIILAIEHHGHSHNLDMIKSMIKFYYNKGDKYNINDFYEILKESALSLLTYHHNRLCIDVFENNIFEKEKEYISFYKNKALDYLELNKLISNSLLMAFYNCYNDYNLKYCFEHNLIQPISIVNHQLNTVLLKGIAETHTHVVGSIPFERQWDWMGREVLDQKESIKLILEAVDLDKSVNFQKIRYGYNGTLVNLIFSIMILRLLLMTYLIYPDTYRNDYGFKNYLIDLENKLTGNERKIYCKIVIHFINGKKLEDLNLLDFNKLIRTLKKILYSQNYTNNIKYFSKKFYEDFIKRFVDVQISDKLYGKYVEYILKHESINYLKENDDTMYKQLFMHYIRVKNFVHSFIVQSSDIKGFLEFQYFFRRQNMIFDIPTNMFATVFDTYLYDQVRFLEMRIGHVKFKYNRSYNYDNVYALQKDINKTISIYYQTILKFINAYLEFLKNNSGYTDNSFKNANRFDELIPQVGLILHFNKRYDDENKCWDNYFKIRDDSFIRYKQYQEECFLNLIIFQKIRGEIRYADEYLIGIDGASNELLSEPWVLAPVFRCVKDKYKDTLKNKALNKYGIKLLPTKDLGITYHVGEVFHSFASGLRHVDEVIDYYGYQNGERIGHGTVLGISVDDYVYNHRIISLPAIELLDNLLWLHHLKSNCNLFKEISISYFEEKIWQITHFIYDIDGHLGGNSRGITLHHLYLAYKKQFQGLDEIDNNILACSNNFNNDDCIFKTKDIWDETKLFHSRHCRCFLRRMVRFIQIDTDNEIIKNIYHEVQQYVLDKIAYRGIIIETNPVSNNIIGEFNGMGNHPIFMMNDAFNKDNNHVMVSINTDDPGVFGTTLKNQYGFILQMLIDKGVPMEKALQWIDVARENGLNSTFINRIRKSRKETIDELEEMKKEIMKKLNQNSQD